MISTGLRPWVSRLLAAAVVAAVMTAAWSKMAAAGAENWNDAEIKWMPYEEGLAAAKKDHRPICLIFYTTWCPHCANYSKVFSSPDVVSKSKSFVMIRLDKDANQALSKKYSPDGEYIPRTLFLAPDGQLDASLTETRDQYKYFYSENQPASIVAGMDRALKKFQ